MQKEGHKVSDSSVVLMTVAVIYKFVLVVMGIGILIFYYGPLADYLQGYLYLYYLGLFLNTLLVVILLFVMVSPKCFKALVVGGEKLLKKLHILKTSGITRPCCFSSRTKARFMQSLLLLSSRDAACFT